MPAHLRPADQGALMLDSLLGPGVVYADEGQLRLDDEALKLQLHSAHWDKAIPCPCPACKEQRDKRPEKAPAAPVQPWERPGSMSYGPS